MVRPETPYAQHEVRQQAVGVQAELGWSFHPDDGGRGYATEAVRAAIECCFGPMGLRRVTANCFAGNSASWRLMERLGMRREAASVRNELHRSRGWQDSYSYALLADEWPTEVHDHHKSSTKGLSKAGGSARVINQAVEQSSGRRR
jgi:RimJ/RimL family protein N-acetyltransferase